MTTAFTDEDLTAYLDDEAAPDLRTRIDAALESDPLLEQRLAALARVDALLKAAVPLPDVPSATLEAAARNLAAAQGGATVVELRRPPSVQHPRAFVPAAMAAALALTIGFAGGLLLRPDVRQDVAVADANGTLHAALQSTPSGTVLARDGIEVRPLLTFQDVSGSACREFETRSAESAAVGVACADGGRWRIAALLAAAPGPVGPDGYRPASGFNDEALDAVLGRLMSGDALSAEAERALMERGWE